MNTFKIFAPTMIASRGEDGKLRIEGVASSTVRDHHGDQLTKRALQKMAESAKGLTIFLNHEYRVPEDIFGTVERVKLERSGQTDPVTKEEIYDLRFGIVVQKKNPRAVQAFESMEAGEGKDPTKLGLSIGAMVPDGGAVFDKSKGGRYIVDDVDLVETSLVSLPANPRSWVEYAVKSLSGKLPQNLTKERSSIAETMEAEGVKVVDGIDEEELVPAAGEDLAEAPADTVVGDTPAEGDESAETATPPDPDVNDSASDEQDANAEEGVKPEPDATTKAQVTVWDGDKVIAVDTGRSKPKDPSAQDDDPENAGSPKSSKKDLELLSDDEAGDEAVTVTLKTSQKLIASLHGQLKASRAENETLTEERDAAIAIAKQSIEGTQVILTKLAELPAGRKTGFTEVTEDFTKFRDDLYDADFQRLLLKGTNTP